MDPLFPEIHDFKQFNIGLSSIFSLIESILSFEHKFLAGQCFHITSEFKVE